MISLDVTPDLDLEPIETRTTPATLTWQQIVAACHSSNASLRTIARSVFAPRIAGRIDLVLWPLCRAIDAMGEVVP